MEPLRNLNEMQKGLAKVNKGQKVYKTKAAVQGKRMVQVNKNTWILTDKSPEQAIADYEEKYKLDPIEKWKSK